jgi:glycerophosphoryl diester phosphodiesterase
VTRLPLVIAHRGDSVGAAGNSLAAFDSAIVGGADMIEFDVRRTKDEQLVVYHNPDIDGVPLARLTHSELTHRAPHPPPLLDEVLDLAKDRVDLDVELKEDGYVATVLQKLLEHHEPERCIVTSFLDDVLLQVKERAPDLRTGLLLGRDNPASVVVTRMTELFPIDRLRRCRADYAAPHQRLARLGALRRAHRAGLQSLVWTVNSDEAMLEFLADERVAGVITDAPRRALALRATLAART